MDSDFMVWDGVPDGASLFVRVDPPGAFMAAARVVRSIAGDPLPELLVSPAALAGAGYRLPVEAPVDYTVRIRIATIGPRMETAVHAWVADAAGQAIGASFRLSVTGTRGDVRRATLIATTRRLQRGEATDV
jgi:hypothetical protein